MSRLSEELKVVPRTGLILVSVFTLGLAAAIFSFAEEPPRVRIAIGTVVALFLFIYLLLVAYVYGDAKRRGMRHVLWTLVAALVPNAVGFIAYFLLRESVLQPCVKCGTPARREFAFCPQCGTGLPRVCPRCHKPVEPIWSHCAHCGGELLETTEPAPLPNAESPSQDQPL